jgi:hypothetical protein
MATGATAHADHVAEREDFGMARKCQIRLDGDASCAIALGPGELCKPSGEP